MTLPQLTSAAKSSSDLSACVSSDDLKQYISGWCDDADAERIESHLATCRTCEQALRELEIKPDTLLQSLQSTTVEKTAANDDATSRKEEQPIDAALAKVRQLMNAPAESAKPVWQPANRELGVYELLRPLGRGGMGAVYLANHRQLHKQVAIKLLPVMSAEDSDVRARFQREIRVVGKLNHPSIVAATDAGEIDGTQFLVMEYVPGMDLSRLARLLGKLPVVDACELMRQVALGLSCAHAEGVVHRDVKPSNLMLDETGRIRILDFGLAQLSFWDEASIELTTVGQLMGTLDYMAPEQAELCGGVDYRADLYAMGATLFRLLCGRPPLAAAPNQSPLEKLRLLANHQPPKLDTLCPEAPPELVKLVASLLARSPQDRPASAAHVAEELAEFTESANLVTLLQRAQEKEAQSPEPIASDRNRRDFMPAMVQSVDAEMQNRERRGTGGLTPPRSPENAGRRRIRRWIIAAVLLPLVFVAGILIKLEADKGQLVIESEVPDVKVRIINDGKPVSDLTINHGTTATRLRADKYEVVIDGPSDGLTIDNNQFTLKNGETVVARIRTEGALNPVTTEDVVKRADSDNYPLYQGRSLSEWLDAIERERSPEVLVDALRACDAMISDTNATAIGERILKVLPQVAGDMTVKNTKSFGNVSSDLLGFSLISRAFPQSFYSIWIRQFENGDAAWRQRLLHHVSAGMLSQFGGTEGVSDVEVFVEWAKKQLQQPVVIDSEKHAEIVQLASTLANGWLAEEEGAFIEALKESPHLDRYWWLKPIQIVPGRDPRMDPSTAINLERARVALKILQDDAADDVLVAEACMTLASFPTSLPDYAGLSDEFKSEIRSAIEKRLDRFLEESSAEQCRIVNVDQKFEQFLTPSVKSPQIWFQHDLWGSGPSPRDPASVICELLDLYVNVRSARHDSQTLKKFAVSISNYIVPKLPYRGDELRRMIARITVQWKYFNSLSDTPIPLKDTSEAEEMSSAIRGSTFSLNREGWLKLILFQHPAIEPYLPKTDTTPDVTLDANSSNASQAKSPLYEGKTLDQWLDMLYRERSPAGLTSVFEACTALASPETSDKITQTILNIVPNLDGERRLTDQAHPTLDQAAFSLLANANSGANFYTVWVDQFEEADENWRKRLWQGFGYGGPQREPFMAWAERRLGEPPTGNQLDTDTVKAAEIVRRFAAAQFAANDTLGANRIATALKDSQHLRPEWWLSKPLVERNIESNLNGKNGNVIDTNIWPDAIKSKMIQVAIDTLEADTTSSILVAQACMILANGAELNPEQKLRVLAAVNRRLVALSASPEQMTELIEINDSFGLLSMPKIKLPAASSPGQISSIPVTITINSNEQKANLVLELLDLVKTLDGTAAVKEGMNSVSQATIATLKLISGRDRVLVTSRDRRDIPAFETPIELRIILNWPELTASDGGPKDVVFGGAVVRLSEIQMLWGEHQPTSQDWLKFCILHHTVMTESVTAMMKELGINTPPKNNENE